MASIFWIDTTKRRLWNEHGEIALAPKPMEVLCALVRRPGDIVSREDLEEAAWSDVRVTDSVLRYSIRQVRQALGDEAGTPAFVATVPRRGWQLVADVRSGGAPGVQRLEAIRTAPSGALPIAFFGGRDLELERLAAALSRARAGTPAAVFVCGEAGIGKTTVLNEFLRRSATLPDLTVASAECVQHYGSEEPFLPVIEVLERLVPAIGEEVATDVLRRHAPSWLAELPGLTDPEERTKLARTAIGATAARMQREFASAIERIATDRTIVLAIDDVHWSDDASLELFSSLIRRPPPLRLLFVATLRPAEIAARRAPLTEIKRDFEIHGRCEEVALEGLSPAAVREYLERRFGTTSPESGDPAAAGEFVHHWTEGNPLFMVSVVDQLVSRGAFRERGRGWSLDLPPEALGAPATVKRLIEQELDRVSPAHAAVLEIASLAGMEFSAASVASASGRDVEAVEVDCEELCRSGRFLHATGKEVWPDGTIASRYRFGHALYRDALADRLPAARRARLHRQIGLRREAAWGDDRAQIAAELAHHFEQAGDATRSMHYFAAAGESAARRYANREAAAYLRRALRLLLAQPPGPERDGGELMLRLAMSVPLAATEGYASFELAQNLERVQDLTDLETDPGGFFPLLLGLWSLHIVRADLATASRIGTRLLDGAARSNDPVTILQAHRVAGHTAFYVGDLETARRHLDEALARYDVSAHRPLDYSFGDDPVVLALSYSSWVLWFQGLADQASARIEQALRTAGELRHPPSLAFALSYAAVLHQLRRDSSRAAETAATLIELADEEALPLWHGLGRIVRGWAWAAAGDGRDGVAELRAGLAEWEATGADLGRPHFLALLAGALGREGRIDQALPLLATAGEVVERTGQAVFEPERWRIEGDLLSSRDPDAAAERYERALEVAGRQGAHALVLRAAIGLARLDLPEARASRARRTLAQARSAVSEGATTRDLRDADELLG